MFVNETKGEYLGPFRVTKTQKETIAKMAEDRNMTISRLILTLLEMEYKNPKIKKMKGESE